MNNKEFTEKALNFAKKEYRERQQRTFDGDPTGFSVLYNLRSKKFSTCSLTSVKLRNLPENYKVVLRVFSNGSVE